MSALEESEKFSAHIRISICTTALPNFPWLDTLPRQLLMPLAGVGLSLALRHAGVFPDGDALPPLGVYRGCMAAWQCGHATPGLFF